MTRRVALLLSLVLAFANFAATRTVDSGTRLPNGATVGGVVTAVNGNLIQLAGGNITIDATNAKIHGTSSAIEPGMLVFATLTTSAVAANAPLPASSISVTRLPDATLFGPVQSVDTANNTLTLLGRTIRVTSETSFGGVRKSREGGAPALSDILPNHIVQVTIDERNGQLVATSVLLLAPSLPEVHTKRGEVKSIDTNAWVIDELTVQIDAQTRIAGSPKVGDTVEVLYRVDSSNANVAISIIKLNLPTPPFVRTTFFSGHVVSMASSAWVVRKDDGNEQVTIKIAEHSKVEPRIAAGDRVDVLAQKHDDGTLTALVIVKRRF